MDSKRKVEILDREIKQSQRNLDYNKVMLEIEQRRGGDGRMYQARIENGKSKIAELKKMKSEAKKKGVDNGVE